MFFVSILICIWTSFTQILPLDPDLTSPSYSQSIKDHLHSQILGGSEGACRVQLQDWSQQVDLICNPSTMVSMRCQCFIHALVVRSQNSFLSPSSVAMWRPLQFWEFFPRLLVCLQPQASCKYCACATLESQQVLRGCLCPICQDHLSKLRFLTKLHSSKQLEWLFS
jgi:hypothetical protein